MIDTSGFLHLPYTHDLAEGGIAHALRSLPYTYNRADGAYDRLRRMVAEAAVEIAVRRYLSEQKVPFEVKAALPFTGHDRYDVMLGGRRCEIKSFLISDREQISQIQRAPELVLKAPALVASDQHAREGASPRDLYLFAFLPGGITTSRNELQEVIEDNQPHYLIHVMPERWNRPSQWIPLGRLVLKSEAEAALMIEIGGQEEGGALRSVKVELPPRRRLEVPAGFFSLAYVHTKSSPPARLGVYSPVRRETYLIEDRDWGNIWVYGMDILLAGYITREEFRRRASFIPTGSRVFQYRQTQVKNLALPMSDLRPLAELFEHVKLSAAVADARGNGPTGMVHDHS